MSTQVVPTSQTSTPVKVKTEEFMTILEHITESFVKALTAASSARASDRPPRPPQSRPRSNNCHFCDLPDHYGHNCEVAADYIKQGKCKHNIKGRITLPSSAFIPRDIPGKCFKEHLDEWHHCNPGQTAAGQLMYNVLSQAVTKPRVVLATWQTHPDIFEAQTILSPQLSTQDRINSLERELLQLCNRKIEGTARLKSKNDRTTDVEITEEPPPRKQVMRPEVMINCTRPPVTRSVPAPMYIQKLSNSFLMISEVLTFHAPIDFSPLKGHNKSVPPLAHTLAQSHQGGQTTCIQPVGLFRHSPFTS
jgi:hypothetical protein